MAAERYRSNNDGSAFSVPHYSIPHIGNTVIMPIINDTNTSGGSNRNSCEGSGMLDSMSMFDTIYDWNHNIYVIMQSEWWLYKIGRSVSFTRKDFNSLHRLNFHKWSKSKHIYVYCAVITHMKVVVQCQKSAIITCGALHSGTEPTNPKLLNQMCIPKIGCPVRRAVRHFDERLYPANPGSYFND